MKHILPSLLFLLAATHLFAQHQLDWVNTPYIENYMNQFIDDMLVDDAGNIFTYQHKYRHSQTAPLTPRFKGIIKQDPYGNVVWQKQLGHTWLPEYNLQKLMVQRNGFLYPMVYEDNIIRLFKINQATGAMDTVMALTVAGSATTNYFGNVFMGYNGHIYLHLQVTQEQGFNALYEFDENDSLINTVSLSGVPGFISSQKPFVDAAGNIYIKYYARPDSVNIDHLRKMNSSGVLINDTILGQGMYAAIYNVDSTGNVLINVGNKLHKFDSNFHPLWTYPGNVDLRVFATYANGDICLINASGNIGAYTLNCIKLRAADGSIVFSHPIQFPHLFSVSVNTTAAGEMLISGLNYVGADDPHYRSHKQIVWLTTLDSAGNVTENFSDTISYRIRSFTFQNRSFLSPRGDMYWAISFDNLGIFPYASTDTATAATMKYQLWYTAKLCNRCSEKNVLGRVVASPFTDCIAASNESPATNTIVHLQPGTRMSTLNNNGIYKFSNVGYGNHQVRVSPPEYLAANCDSQYAFSLNTANPGAEHNFELTPQNGCRMFLGLHSTRARSGRQQQVTLQLFSSMWQPANGWVAVTTDSLLTFSHCSFFPDSISGKTCFWKYERMVALDKTALQIFYNVAIINSVSLTYYTINASFYSDCSPGIMASQDLTDVVFNSYDPNDKQVFPVDLRLSEQFADKTQPIVYQINFQNSGNDTAFRIVLCDTIEPNLDMSTFRMITASHPYKLVAGDNRDVAWVFDEINLLPKNQSEILSQGYVKFSMVPKSSINYGEQINNYASIYFDFNNRIITNNTHLTYLKPNGVREITTQAFNVTLYPNPATEKLVVQCTDQASHISVCNVTGALVAEFNNPQELTVAKDCYQLSIGHLTLGVYIAYIKSNNGTVIAKWVKM